LLVALFYAPLVLVNLPLGIALWIPIVSIHSLPVVWIAPNAALILIALAWLGTLAYPRRSLLQGVGRHRRLWVLVGLLLIWVALTLGWATKPGTGLGGLWALIVGALIFLIITSTISAPRHIALVVGAVVAGSALSVAIGLFHGGLGSPGADLPAGATETEGRLQGGAGDPNYLAASLVPALVLGAALLGVTRKLSHKWALVLALGILAVGFAATESRGGLIGGGVAVVTALIFFKGRRFYVLALIALIGSVAGFWFAANPAAWDRVTQFGSGSGRTDLWKVAWRMSKDHPVGGVGINNFQVRSPDYVRQPGPLKRIDLIVDKPHVEHNLYLQFLAETGVIGLAFFMAIVFASLGSAWLAGRRFDALGRRDLADLARAALVGGAGMLGASTFISNGGDWLLWIVLALGPALLSCAERLRSQAYARQPMRRARPMLLPAT
jgi:O-antigen ligase